MRKPTLEEEVLAWRHLAWEIDLHRKITMDHDRVVACLDRLSAWVGAHSDHNGERPESEVLKNVHEAFWKHIAKAEPKPLPPKRGPGRPKKVKPE